MIKLPRKELKIMKQLNKEAIVNHPATSYWLKNALTTIDDRDPVDALRDIRTLQIYVEQKLHRAQFPEEYEQR